MGQSQTRGNYCPGSTPGKVRCRELGRSCSSLAVIKEGKLELPVCCCMQIVSFVPVSNSSPCRMSRMCNNPAGMCTQRCQEMGTCRIFRLPLRSCLGNTDPSTGIQRDYTIIWCFLEIKTHSQENHVPSW